MLPYGSVIVKANVLPAPRRLDTVIEPPIMATSCEEMVSPSPVPPYLRVVELSACENDSKIVCSLSGAIPMPVSRTLNAIVASAARWFSAIRTVTSISPDSVNLIAFPTRLTMIWRSRPGSPSRRSGTPGATFNSTSRFFWWPRIASERIVSRRVSSSEKPIDSRRMCPASILEKSRMSLTICSSASADDLTMPRYSRWSAVSSVSSTRSVMPMTPFIGVRISWLMLARKSLLTRLASSAASLAATMARSASLRAVMSVRIAMYCVMRPCSPVSGTRVALTQYRSPLRLRLQISPCQTRPAAMVPHMSSKKARSCVPEPMMRWFCPSSSSRV